MTPPPTGTTPPLVSGRRRASSTWHVGATRTAAAARIDRQVPALTASRIARLRASCALGLVCLVLGAFLKLPEAVESPGSDTGMFATYGAMLLHGARPYVDFWDLHPPLVYAYWAFVQAISGGDWLQTCISIDNLAPQSCVGMAAHGLDLLLSVGAALVVGAIARRSGGSAWTAALAALLVVGFADQVMLSREGSNPSKLTLLPSSVAVWAYLVSQDDHRAWGWALLAGMAGAIAALAKQPALLTLAALAGHAAWRRDRARLVGLLLGSGVILAVTCVALAAVDSLDGFVAQVWVYNVERTFMGYFVHPAKAPVIDLGRVLMESAGALALLTVIGGFVIAWAPSHSRHRLVVWWPLVNLIAVTAFREFVYVVPSFAVLGALGFERIWGWGQRQERLLGRSLLVAVCVVCVLLTTSFQRVELARARFERDSGSGPSPTEKLGLILDSDLPPGPLFIYGNGAELYPLAGRMPAARYLNGEALRSAAPGAQTTRADLVASLERDSPPVIVLAPHSDEAELNLSEYSSMRAFLQACYTPNPIRPDLDATWTILVQTGVCGSRLTIPRAVNLRPKPV
jgi:hypothetical protein